MTPDPATTTPTPNATRIAGAEEIAERLDAVARHVRAGDVERGGHELALAMDALSGLERGPIRASLRARAEVERARVRWLGLGLDPTFTLGGAFEMATGAWADVGRFVDPRLRVEITSTIAGIACDLGDGSSLARAWQILHTTIEALAQDGATLEATMLLNDEGSLVLRMGRVEEARALARRSYDELAQQAERAATPELRAELADTEHLLARLVLHDASAGPASFATALAHAQSAATIYEALGFRRDLGRVVETTARIEAHRGAHASARALFRTALRLADETTDLLGLARNTAGLAALLAEEGATEDALAFLLTSIESNRQKRSAVGLSADERVLDDLERHLGDPARLPWRLVEEIRETREKLSSALASCA